MMDSVASPERTPIIQVRNVGVSYWLRGGLFKRQAHWPLKNVSFDLYEGDSLGIVGRNGAGKSTLLRLLANVMSPDCGEIVNRGASMSLLSLNLGFVDYLSGRENAILGGMFLGMRKADIEAKLNDIAAFSELDEFFHQPISSYSSGMRGRLAFAVAFQISPDILLVDEVTGVGDTIFREKSMSVMKERIRSHENTIVFVSHSASTVKQLCNRAVWIEDGVARMQGDTASVLEAYTDFMRTEARERIEGQVQHHRMALQNSRVSEPGRQVERVEFVDDNARRFLGNGWGNIEYGGPWSVGESAVLRFQLDEVRNPKIVLFAKTYQPQRVEIEFNGEEVVPITMDGSNYREVPLDIPPGFFRKKNRLVFRLPDRTSPKSIGDGPDPRMLGIRIYWFEIRN